MNLPNKLTISRILLIPVFILFLIYGYHFFAMLTFALASFTDALDGIIARATNQRSKAGAFLDPIADKLLINATFVALAVMRLLPCWIVALVMIRDLVIVLGIMVMYMANKTPAISPTYLSKATTLAQMLTLLVALLDLWTGGLSSILWFFIWTSALLTLLSGFDYVYRGARMMMGST
jgi:cardiolipin synthase